MSFMSLELVALWGSIKTSLAAPLNLAFLLWTASRAKAAYRRMCEAAGSIQPDLANWTDEDGRCGGQHFEQAAAVKTNALGV